MTRVYLLGVLSIKSVLLDALIHKEMPFVLVDKRHFFTMCSVKRNVMSPVGVMFALQVMHSCGTLWEQTA